MHFSPAERAATTRATTAAVAAAGPARGQYSGRRRSLGRLVAFVAGLVLVVGPLGVPAAPVLVRSPIQASTASAKLGWTSANWSGYVVTAGPYTSVTSTWIVPTVTASATSTYSSTWVGIDGYGSSNLIQTGTEQDFYDGAAHYSAWWEILPAAGTDIPSMTVHAGDKMAAKVAKDAAGGTWTITLANVTTGTTFSTTQRYNGRGSSAEWIQEAPTVGGRTARLAQFSPLTFTGTANGRNPGLIAQNGGSMVQNGVTVSTPSTPGSNGAFTVRSSGLPGAAVLTAKSLGSTNHRIALSWTAAAANGSAVTKYRIYRVTPAGAVLVATVANVRTWTDTHNAAARTSSYRVVAVNGLGAGVLSNTASAFSV